LEINLGNIKSLPNLDQLNLNKSDIELLSKNKDYDYEISLVGRKLEEEEIEDKENFDTGNYSKNIKI
jgi:hypothetical protein